MSAEPREWDAATYQRISVPHEEWAEAVLARLPLAGDETVLDAGCGTGRVTRMLIERLPEGRVIGVDGSTAMVEKVREILRPQDEAFAADLTRLELPEPVDAVVSSAVFHWIHDHDELFAPPARLPAAGRPAGRPVRRRRQHRRLPPGGQGGHRAPALRAVLRGLRRPLVLRRRRGDRARGCAPPASRRSAAGSSPGRWSRPSRPSSPARSCSPATSTACRAELRDRFVADVLAAAGEPLTLDYVRLNIDAVAA